jgi:hypothetical protein
MRITRSLIGALALILFALPASQAAAQDGKVFPGALCNPFTSGPPPDSEEQNFDRGNGAINAEAPGLDIVCPIVRDEHLNTTGFKLYAWTYDFWESEETVCTAHITRNDTGGTLDLDFETRSSGVAATGYIKLDWGTSLGTGAAYATYYMNCNVPTYHRLLSYRSEE